MTYCPLTPERKAENDAVIAAYEKAELSGDPALYWPAFARIEQRMNGEYLMGETKESDRIRNEMNRIVRERREREKSLASVAKINADLCSEILALHGMARK